MNFLPPDSYESFLATLDSIARLPVQKQLRALKSELLDARQRETSLFCNCAELKQAVRNLRNKIAERDRSAFADWLQVEFAQATRELEIIKAEQEKSLRRLRVGLAAARATCEDLEKRLHNLHLELNATEVSGQELEQTCQSLLLVIEQAAGSASEEDRPEGHVSEARA
jgi:uncharacterized coiled-coil protein SlyX